MPSWNHAYIPQGGHRRRTQVCAERNSIGAGVKDKCPFETFTDGVREETQTLEVVPTDGRAGFDFNAEHRTLASEVRIREPAWSLV